jgi:Fe-S-cluster containining protein
MPIFYECDRCTACCRWPGQVRLSDSEITGLAAFLGMMEFDFVQRYTRLTADRQGLALEDKPNGECIFLEGNDCAVNAVKPQQCRDFPNLWNFPGFEGVCRAKAVMMNDEAYTKAMEKATGRNEKNSVSKCR